MANYRLLIGNSEGSDQTGLIMVRSQAYFLRPLTREPDYRYLKAVWNLLNGCQSAWYKRDLCLNFHRYPTDRDDLMRALSTVMSATKPTYISAMDAIVADGRCQLVNQRLVVGYRAKCRLAKLWPMVRALPPIYTFRHRPNRFNERWIEMFGDRKAWQDPMEITCQQNNHQRN